MIRSQLVFEVFRIFLFIIVLYFFFRFYVERRCAQILFVGRRSVFQVVAENAGKVAEVVVGWSWGRYLVGVFGVNLVIFSFCLLYVDGDSLWVLGRVGNNGLVLGLGLLFFRAQVGGFQLYLFGYNLLFVDQFGQVVGCFLIGFFGQQKYRFRLLTLVFFFGKVFFRMFIFLDRFFVCQLVMFKNFVQQFWVLILILEGSCGRNGLL